MDDNSFIETCLPCPKCGSSDALAMNADGSTKCLVVTLLIPEIIEKQQQQLTDPQYCICCVHGMVGSQIYCGMVGWLLSSFPFSQCLCDAFVLH